MEYIKAIGIWYANELPTIKKKKDTILQPIYEAFTNAWEALVEKYSIGCLKNGTVLISFYLTRDLFSQENQIYNFDKIVICDNGAGITEKGYTRLINLRDDSKRLSNKGTGRIQYVHFFDKTTIESDYANHISKTGYSKRIITLSKSAPFLKENSIMRLDEYILESQVSESSTTVTFELPLDIKDLDYYIAITAKEVKEEMIRHFLSRFCDNRIDLPHIIIKRFFNYEEVESEEINAKDIPMPDKEKPIEVSYSKLNEKNKIISTSQKETFEIKSFVLPESTLDKNAIYLVSKGEIAKDISLDNLLPTETINGNRYLFLLTGKYIDENDDDTRGNINLITAKQFKKQEEASLFPEQVILLDNIENEANKTIGELYGEIEEKNIAKKKNIDELQKMFLLNPKIVNTLRNKIKNTDSDETILREIYKSEVSLIAQTDAQIKQQLKDIESLTPADEDYQKKLHDKVNEFVKIVPLQNRTALTQYVARRKLVLELFDKILRKELDKLKNGERIDENILHNLIFQRTTTSSEPEDSDLWLINEDFIYFEGVSENKLCNIEIEGKRLLKEKLSDEEMAYKNKCGKDAGNRRPDILLFPAEGKCIIIEFKAPDVDVAEHLHQINRYARLINNLSDSSYKFDTYYGYLIGENIDIDEVQDSDPNFKSAHGLGYIFRPYLPVTGKFGRSDGALYTEIIKYSDLLKRAQIRNKIFIDKLEKGNKKDD